MNASEEARTREVDRLLAQPRIDPLTDYLAERPIDLRYIPHRQRVARERDARCDAVGERYADMAPSAENLAQLKADYSHSCYAQVNTFERRVDKALAKNSPAESYSPFPPFMVGLVSAISKMSDPQSAPEQEQAKAASAPGAAAKPPVQEASIQAPKTAQRGAGETDSSVAEPAPIIDTQPAPTPAEPATPAARPQPATPETEPQPEPRKTPPEPTVSQPQIAAVTTQPEPESKPESEPEQATRPRAPASTLDKDSRKHANNCYLLFAIRNYQEAHGACLSAARAGDAKSQHHIASLARISNEADAAIHWSTLSAEQGYGPGQLLLADLYTKGEGAARDEARALELVEQAAQQGFAEARFRAGQAYLQGKGTEPDMAKALQHLEQAAAQDHLAAQLALAEQYSAGEQPNTNKSREWLKRAAAQQSAEAQYNLGMSYAQGSPDDQEALEAYIWLSKAMLNGETRARSHLERIANTLTPEQLQLGQQRVQSDMRGRRS
ncbi:tetratricopeptide repeat protein [Pseudomonas saliphila]|uniref:tetratricopeptide repeat protein n=1 Tax=Pseudomonas saliphila TaxID=2586906 RepID=UPI0015B46F6F|nr:tetratricopeptide repeat protein [Pseudomonas saliphila]